MNDNEAYKIKLHHRLVARVRAVNLANSLRLSVYNTFRPVFEPLINQQIVKVTGGLMARVEKQLPTFVVPEEPRSRIYVTKSLNNYSLSWNIQAMAWDESGTEHASHDVSVYVASISNNVMVRLYDPPEPMAERTVDEVLKLRLQVEAAEKALRAARSALDPFREHDNW